MEKTLNQTLKYWPLVIAIVGIITMWVTIQKDQESTFTRINTLEAKTQSIDISNNQILVQLSQIQADLSWIKLNIKK